MIVPPDQASSKSQELIMTATEKQRPTTHLAAMTEIIVSPGELVQVLNIDAESGAMPNCRFAFEYDHSPHTVFINCMRPCLGSDSQSSETVGQWVQARIQKIHGFSVEDILTASGLLEAAHLSIASLNPADRLRVQTLRAVLEREKVLVFDFPWAQDGTDFFLLDLLYFLRQHHIESGILPVFVVRDCGDLPALSILASSIWEVEDGVAVAVEMECRWG